MGRIVRVAAATLVTVGLAGCWPAPGQGPDRRAHNPFETAVDVASAPTLAEVWTGVTDPDAGEGGRVSAPTVSATAVHVSDETAAVHAFDRRTGERLWSYPDPGEIAYWQPSPIVEGDRVLFSKAVTIGEGGSPYSDSAWLDARTGARLEDLATGVASGRRGQRTVGYGWFGSFASGFASYSLVVTDERDPGTGWGGTIMFAGSALPQRPPTLGAHRVYHSGTVTEEYSTTADRNVTGVHAFPLTPPATDCVAPLPEYPQLPTISCPLWTTPTDAAPVTSPVVAPGEAAIYVGLGDGTLLALGPTDGAELWRATLAAAPSADPALADGWLYVPLANGTLAVLDADGCGSPTCTPAWTAPVGGAGAQPAVAGHATPGADGVVLVGTDAGDLVALPAAGCGAAACTPVATIDVGGPVTGAPAVTSGRVYLGVGPDRVVALAPATPAGSGG